MAAKFIEIRVSDGSTYGAGTNADAQLYFPKTHVSQVVDLLDNNSKIDIGLLPAFMFGSPKYLNTIDTGITLKQLVLQIIGKANELGMEDLTLLYGLYFQAANSLSFDFTQTINVTQATEAELYAFFGETVLFFSHSGDDGEVGTSTLTIEANDYLVFSNQTEPSSGEFTLHFSVINNTYNDATATLKGVVQLATEADITTGTNTTKAVTPAGAKKAVQQFGYTHPSIAPSIGTLGTLKAIANITLSGDGNHIATITTGDIPTAHFAGKGVIENATEAEAKMVDLAPYAEGYAVSPPVAKSMIDYWGKVDYFATLAEANASPTKNVAGKMILVGV